jgi:lipopolysaccharide export system protein LptA
MRQTLLYGPDPGYVDTRVGEDTELRSNVAIVRSPDGGAGDASASDQQTLELYDGTVTLDRPGCIDSEQRADGPSVTLVQGRTTVKGSRFFLDQGTDTGTMDGPIDLERAAAGDSPSLSASADQMEFDTQTRHATLVGHVRVTSQDRVTTADSLELDEAAGIALMKGSPAKSVKGNDVLQGSTLRYYLDTNDVVVLGNVHGDLEVDLP